MRDSWPFGSRVKNLKMATPSGCLSLPRLLEFRVHELEARAVDGGDEAREDLLLGRRGVDADDELEHILILKSYCRRFGTHVRNLHTVSHMRSQI